MADWADELDRQDVCEVCGQLTAPNRLYGRMSLAITMLYTHGIISAHVRDSARKRLQAHAKAA